MSDAIALLLALIGGWALGHTPALFARYIWKKAPLSRAAAIFIASVGCASLVLAVVAAHETYGVPEHARTWASWIGVSSLVSIATMTRGKREHLIPKLRAMIADPATTDEGRALASGRLRQLEEIAAKRAPNRSLAFVGRLPLMHSTSGEHDKARAGTGSKTSRAEPFQYKRLVIYAVGAVLTLNIAIMATEYRVLVHEKIVPPSMLEVPDGWTVSPMIDCSYWTGRSVKVASRPYGVGHGAIDECPLLFKPRNGL